jgi:hypothetical protein
MDIPAQLERFEENSQPFVSQIITDKKEDNFVGRISQFLASGGTQGNAIA